MMSRKRISGTLTWLENGLSLHRRHIAIALALGLAALGFGAMLMFTAGYLICRTAEPSVTVFMVMVPVAFVQLFGLGRPVARYFERLVSHDWVFRVTSRLRLLLFNGIAAKAAEASGDDSTGERLDMLTEDVGHLQNLYLRCAFPVIMALLLGMGFVLLCGAFSTVLALSMLALLIVCAALLPYLALMWTRTLSKQLKESKSLLHAKLADDIMGATDWSLSGRSRQAAASHVRALSSMRKLDRGLRRRSRTIELASSLVLAFGACAIAVVCGLEFGAHQDMANWTAAFVLGFFPVMEALVILPASFSASNGHIESLDRLSTILPHGESKLRNPQAVQTSALNTCVQGAQDDTGRTPKAHPRSEGASVSIGHASYRYPETNRDALRGIDLDIPMGQTIAVLGKSGSGKSTLANMIRGALEPDAGYVDVFGQDARDLMKCNAMAQWVGFIPQQPHLFDCSLRDNIAIANPEASDDDIREAIARTGLDDCVALLENGLDTHVGETGFGFSGGESHRIALARAFVANAPIILLDEPFAALDTETERKLIDTLLEAFEDKTLFVITHHLMGIGRFDRVLLIEDGRIVADGEPSALLEREPRFRELLAFDGMPNLCGV